MTDFSKALLDWYDAHARDLPWRVSPEARKAGVRPEPYHVWLSEIMLQQTTIPHGIPYFLKFLSLWPNVQALAAADREDVLREWAGLGYYARARNLHACAKVVAEMGGFPGTADALIALPGIGPYTAGAIAAIAFDQRVAAVDGNVERVLTRYYALEKPVRDMKPQLREKATHLLPDTRAGDFIQAFMDLGATICSPRNPNCEACPVARDCQARKEGRAEAFPVKPEKKAKPERFGQVFIVSDGEHVQLERRPETGLLGGMLGLPTSVWTPLATGEAVPAPPSDISEGYVGRVQHVFTHFRLWLDVYGRHEKTRQTGEFCRIEDLNKAGLPSVFAKAAKLWLEAKSKGRI